jgi:hypothetical protein
MSPPEKKGRGRPRGSTGPERPLEPPVEGEPPTPAGDDTKVRDPLEGIYVTKLSDEVTERIVSAIRAGGTLETAARFAGVHSRTMQRWMKVGRHAVERTGGVPELLAEEEQPYVRFVEALERALAEFKLALTTGIYSAAQAGQWTAYAWLGERRFPDEFGRRQRIDHANADGSPFQVSAAPAIDTSKLSNEELDTLIELYEKAKPGSIEPAQKLLESG